MGHLVKCQILFVLRRSWIQFKVGKESMHRFCSKKIASTCCSGVANQLQVVRKLGFRRPGRMLCPGRPTLGRKTVGKGDSFYQCGFSGTVLAYEHGRRRQVQPVIKQMSHCWQSRRPTAPVEHIRWIFKQLTNRKTFEGHNPFLQGQYSRSFPAPLDADRRPFENAVVAANPADEQPSMKRRPGWHAILPARCSAGFLDVPGNAEWTDVHG